MYTEEEKAWVAQNAENEALITAFQLKKLNDITAYEVENIKPKYLEVHYEQFVKDPEAELNRILEFADLDPFDIDKHLKAVKIYNRNKKDSEYFSASDLKEIYRIIGVD